MNIRRTFWHIFDRITDFMAFLAGVLVILIMLSTVYEIVMRYFLGFATRGQNELSGYSILYITFLATTWLLRKNRHVRMDIVFNLLHPRTQIIFNIVTSSICALICLVIVWYSGQVTLESFQQGYLTTSELETPRFLFLLIIPIGSLMLFIQFLRMMQSYLTHLEVKGP